MTDKEKLEKIKSLADKMSDTAFNLTTDASLLRKAMKEYHQFIINEYHKEEQVIKELQEEPVNNNYSVVLLPCIYNKTLEERIKYCKYCSAACEGRVKEPISEDLEKAANDWDAKASFTPFYMTLDDKGNPNGVKQDYTTHAESFKAGSKWQIAKLMTNVIDAQCFGFQGAALFSFRLPADNYLVGSKVKVIVIKED